MVLDWSATASWIALAVAILAPVLTAFLNNKHQLKLKKIELFHNEASAYFFKKRDVYCGYIEHASCLFIDHSTLEKMAIYSKMYHELFLYCDKEIWEDIELLNNHFNNNVFDSNAKELFLKITKYLADELKTTMPKPI
ncbi:hypothetical protein [Anaerosacchariphilus polymeriproducens]|uniref:DUF4760 domain-containing protein n=1 Tax=Anaerosacchariphilus polymeriproducens TaxID=1812858 RepID=A0A371AZ34_9FIRM|nr:hypothetical protein [Anaerosacchariphilus polymeriproducens]RDU24762.1 hypothetical protein DWV06_02605 [Anaerosacchariphilus polymeriproducens]